MPRIIATCWDDQRWLAAIAQTRGKSFVVERWLEGEATSSGPNLLSALDAARIKAEGAWVAVGRSRMELRAQKLPLIPVEELPAVVRMQALQQASSDRLLCDYLPLQSDERGTEVLVATAGGELLDAVQKSLGSTPVERLALRPLCSAAWLSHIALADNFPTMLIDPRVNEVDFVVFRDRTPAFIRTVRLPEDPRGAAEVLATEARRSLITAGMSDALGTAAPKITLWGDTKIGEQFLPSLQRTLGNQVRCTHPGLGQTQAGMIPANADVSSIAAVLGLLWGGVTASDLLIDLVQPRKPPDPPNLKQRYTMIGSGVAAAVALIGWLGYSNIKSLSVEIADLTKESNGLTQQVDRANEQKSNLLQLQKFTDGNVHWLEQLAKYSEVAPGADKLMIKSITGQASTAAGGRPATPGGSLTITGTVTAPEVLDDLDEGLRKQNFGVKRGKVNEESGAQRTGYRWAFSEVIQVDPWKPEKALEPRGVTTTEPSAQVETDKASEKVSDEKTESKPPVNEPKDAAPEAKPETSSSQPEQST